MSDLVKHGPLARRPHATLELLVSTHKRMQPVDAHTNPCDGVVYWKWSKSLWYAATIASLAAAPFTISPGAVVVSFVLTATTLCLGHTLGMHRRLIHESYACPRGLEYLFVYLGVLVGIAGPFRIIYLHDIRDWSQRHPRCHTFFIHTQPWWRDWCEQLHCDIRLTHPPRFLIEDRVRLDPFYRFLQQTWMLQQVPVAVVLYLAGGIGWVVWGVGVRLFLSLTGHWLVGWLAHNRGGRHWHIEDAAVQGYNVRGLSLLTMGENWHNNHHAYPESARLGLARGEWDPGWLILSALRRFGLVWNVATPDMLPARRERVELEPTIR
jgi:stearoyl-CoA desaturase (delta-9 desaturase)